jgi:hypothetical protein
MATEVVVRVMATVEQQKAGTSGARIAAWSAAVLAWIFFSMQITSGESLAYQLGEVVGALAVTLAVAAVIRGLYWLIRRRSVQFWSPWLFVIAAVIGALARLGRAGEESAAVLALLV